MYCVNIGRVGVGEVVETLWSKLTHLVRTVRSMTTSNFHNTMELMLLKLEAIHFFTFPKLLHRQWVGVQFKAGALLPFSCIARDWF